MGMYDTVTCKKPLPDGWVTRELQTKDFDYPHLEHYTIDDDGRLYKDAARYDNGSGNERHDTNWHGMLNFYGSEGDVNSIHEPDCDYRWHEYNAKFTDGQLVEIALVKEESG